MRRPVPLLCEVKLRQVAKSPEPIVTEAAIERPLFYVKGVRGCFATGAGRLCQIRIADIVAESRFFRNERRSEPKRPLYRCPSFVGVV